VKRVLGIPGNLKVVGAVGGVESKGVCFAVSNYWTLIVNVRMTGVAQKNAEKRMMAQVEHVDACRPCCYGNLGFKVRLW